MQNLTAQKICLGLVTLIFFVAAPWITAETLGGNNQPLVLLGAVALLLIFVYGLGDRCWIVIPFCLPIEGNLNFVPFGFSIQEISIIIVFCYLFLKMIFGQDVAWRLGPALLWVPLAGVLAVVAYHWISSGDIGIKLLGGSGWGGRRYFKVALAASTLPLLASYPAMRWQDLLRVPLIYFLGSFVDIVPELLTTFIPAAAPLVWRVYSCVNLGEYGATLQGNFGGEQGIGRIGTLAKLGTALGLVCLCYFPPRTWLQPNRLWALPTLLMGGLLCALSGFRNYIFRYGLAVAAGLFATMRFRALFLLPVLTVAALAVGWTQGAVFNYPITVQRALSFMPGNWDVKAVNEAKASTDWRRKITELFFKEYFSQAPLLGQGYHFDPNLAKSATDAFLAVAQARMNLGDEYADVRTFVEMRQPHEGPVHILLVTGCVGAFFFVSFCVALLVYSFGSAIKTPPRLVHPLQIWSVSIIFPLVVAFFTVFGDLTNFLIVICPTIALLYRFEIHKARDHGNLPSPAQDQEFGAPPKPLIESHAPAQP